MKKGEKYEGIIEYVDFPNKGRIQIDNEWVTVKNGIPGQRVEFQINKKAKGQNRGTASSGIGKISVGNQRAGLQYFSGVRRLYVSDDGLCTSA